MCGFKFHPSQRQFRVESFPRKSDVVTLCELKFRIPQGYFEIHHCTVTVTGIKPKKSRKRWNWHTFARPWWWLRYALHQSNNFSLLGVKLCQVVAKEPDIPYLFDRVVIFTRTYGPDSTYPSLLFGLWRVTPKQRKSVLFTVWIDFGTTSDFGSSVMALVEKPFYVALFEVQAICQCLTLVLTKIRGRTLLAK